EPPFTPERILHGLHGDAPAKPDALPGPVASALPGPVASRPSSSWKNPLASRRGGFATIGVLSAGIVSLCAAILPWRAIAPITRPDASVYSAATIARGEQLAALGNCAVCHTTASSPRNAGGRPLETPFGMIYSTNITPDVETGIGAWSYPAFER